MAKYIKFYPVIFKMNINKLITVERIPEGLYIALLGMPDIPHFISAKGIIHVFDILFGIFLKNMANNNKCIIGEY